MAREGQVFKAAVTEEIRQQEPWVEAAEADRRHSTVQLSLRVVVVVLHVVIPIQVLLGQVEAKEMMEVREMVPVEEVVAQRQEVTEQMAVVDSQRVEQVEPEEIPKLGRTEAP